MSFIVMCTDKPGALELRQANRDAHLKYVEDTGVVTMAGPFMDDDGTMNGSLLALDVATRAEAEAWAEADPYAKAGVFETVDIRAWKQVR